MSNFNTISRESLEIGFRVCPFEITRHTKQCRKSWVVWRLKWTRTIILNLQLEHSSHSLILSATHGGLEIFLIGIICFSHLNVKEFTEFRQLTMFISSPTKKLLPRIITRLVIFNFSSVFKTLLTVWIIFGINFVKIWFNNSSLIIIWQNFTFPYNN